MVNPAPKVHMCSYVRASRTETTLGSCGMGVSWHVPVAAESFEQCFLVSWWSKNTWKWPKMAFWDWKWCVHRLQRRGGTKKQDSNIPLVIWETHRAWGVSCDRYVYQSPYASTPFTCKRRGVEMEIRIIRLGSYLIESIRRMHVTSRFDTSSEFCFQGLSMI